MKAPKQNNHLQSMAELAFCNCKSCTIFRRPLLKFEFFARLVRRFLKYVNHINRKTPLSVIRTGCHILGNEKCKKNVHNTFFFILFSPQLRLRFSPKVFGGGFYVQTLHIIGEITPGSILIKCTIKKVIKNITFSLLLLVNN